MGNTSLDDVRNLGVFPWQPLAPEHVFMIPLCIVFWHKSSSAPAGLEGQLEGPQGGLQPSLA